jgi:AraC-like DNA-binding protein
VIIDRMTEFLGAHRPETRFAPNMLGQTDAFALLDGKGRIRVVTAGLHPDRLAVMPVRSTGHWDELTEDGVVTVLVPSSGQLRVRGAAAADHLAAGSVCLVRPDAGRMRIGPPAPSDLFHAGALMIPIRTLQDLVQAGRDDALRWLGLPEAAPQPPRPAAIIHLSARVNVAPRHAEAGIPMTGQTAAALSAPVAEAAPPAPVRVPPVRPVVRVLPAAQSRVRLAEEIMRARSNEPLSIADVAREVGVSLRSLQLAFIGARGMKPRDVLLRMRLERARERLQSAGPAETVTTIAMDCGFAHLGRFPATYRTAFGELPSVTLSCARCRMA